MSASLPRFSVQPFCKKKSFYIVLRHSFNRETVGKRMSSSTAGQCDVVRRSPSGFWGPICGTELCTRKTNYINKWGLAKTHLAALNHTNIRQEQNSLTTNQANVSLNLTDAHFKSTQHCYWAPDKYKLHRHYTRHRDLMMFQLKSYGLGCFKSPFNLQVWYILSL